MSAHTHTHTHTRVEDKSAKAKTRIFAEPAKILTVDTLEGLICTHEAS